MDKKRNQDRIDELVKLIKYHRDLYYNQQPEISDAKYDTLEDELRELEPSNPIFSEVGFDFSELFTKKEHIIPMMSQDKVTAPPDFEKWVKKRDYKTFLVQFKLDGISIELQYEGGKFKCAVTRGNGKIGDDVSANVVKMKGFVPRLKANFTGAVRGEVLMFHKVYEQKYSDKQNCRNAAAGIVRRKDGVGNEDLDIILYDAITMTEDVEYSTEIDKLKWMEQEGFPTIKNREFATTQEVIDFREEVMDSIRASLDYDIDGLVIKGMEIDIEDMKRARPMKQIAFKFQAEEIETIVKEVEWSTSGPNYTPIAIVETVRLMGSNVSRASLANPNLIKDLNLKIGSEVIISKRGDIIPKIESVIQSPDDAQIIDIPKICEVCNTKLINEGTRLYCPNEDCEKRYYFRLKKWIKILDVKNFSEKLIIRKLFDNGRIRTIADLYSLTPEDLIGLEGVQEKSANKALNNLSSIKEIPLAKFIAGFNIENIGETLVQRIVDAGFDTFDKINSATEDDISLLEGFADITANYFVEGIKKRLSEMKELLYTKKIKITESKNSSILEGLTFCFTGKLETISRKEAEQLVLENGGQAKSGVVRGLSYLVTNDTTPTAKYKKAEAQGTSIITEQDFLDMIK